MKAYARGLDVLGGDVLGMLDIGQAQRNMNDLKPVTVEIARILLKGGAEAIASAVTGAQQPWYKANLPGESSRAIVAGKLAWHRDALEHAPGDPQTTAYASGDDLKKVVMSAYVEANAVEEGSAYLETSWRSMWTEIAQRLAAIPKAAVKALVSTAGDVGEAITGVPRWALAAGLVAVVGLVGYVALKVYVPVRLGR